MHTLALRIPQSLAGLALVALSACSDAKSPTDGDGRVTINSNSDDLSTHVETKDEPVDVEAMSAAGGLVVTTQIDYALTLVAEVAPPEIDGVRLQATSVAFHDGLAVVSYNMAGEVQQGAVDVFVVEGSGASRQPKLTSRATFSDTDVNAVGSHGGVVYLATATADESFGTPAVLEALAVHDGQLALDGHVRVGLSSYAATSVAFDRDLVFVASGNTGGVHVFDPATGLVTRSTALADARWLAAPGDGTIVAVQGTPGRIAIFDETDLAPLAEYPFDGAQIPESKSTVEVVGGKAFIAGGPGGTIIMDIATGNIIAQVPVPLSLPLPASDIVTNAVSVDDDLVFASNGAAGVFMVAASDTLAKPFDADVPPTFRNVGRLDFPGETASVNHIAYRDGFLFVATGLGGLKIVRVDKLTPEVTPPTGFPYASTFDDPSARAGWTMSGAWGFGAPDGDRAGRGGAFIDDNPAGLDQYSLSTNQVALLDVPLVVPADGVPVVSFDYNAAFLHADDRVELQLEGAPGTWSTKVSFDKRSERAGLATRTFYLSDYLGKTTRIRFKQINGKANGARRFVIDDLKVAPLALPTVSWPYATGFESELERAQWNLEGAWDWSNDAAFDGDHGLDANPKALSLDNYNSGQVATMKVFVPVPAEGPQTVGFWYRSDLVHDNDKIDVDIQTEGSPVWHDLTRLAPINDHAGWTYRELSLASYAGKSVRVRVVMSFAAGGALARRFALDSLRFGPLAGPELSFPFACSDATCSDWIAEGMLSASAGDDGLTITADPAMMSASGDGHQARMLGFVTVPTSGGSVLSFDAVLGFLDAGDKLIIDVQDRTTGQWLNLQTYGLAHARPRSHYELPLDGFAGRSVRLRMRVYYGANIGQRQLEISDVRIEGQPATRYAFPYSPAVDADDLADWAVTGSWQIGDGDVDANPLGAGMANLGDGHDLIMGGYVELPASGRPTLFASLDIALTDSADRVYLELQAAGEGAWTRLRTYTREHNRDDYGWDELPLGAWLGKAVRVRLRFAFGASSAPRLVRFGGLRIEELALPVAKVPWSTSFDTALELDAWSLWGAWSGGKVKGAHTAASGTGFLDGNPNDLAQSKWDDLQTATLGYLIAVPTTGPAWLGFEHHFVATHKDDRLRLEVQTADSPSWATLASLSAQHARDRYAPLELSLDGFRGKSIRLRFVIALGASSDVHVIAVDDLWVGTPTLPKIAAPYDHTFAAADPSWSLHGTFGFAGGALRSNPLGRDTAGFQTFHTATLDAVVDLTGLSAPVLDISYTLALTNSGDRAYVEVLAPSANQWTAIASLKMGDNTATSVTRQYSLTAYANSQVRVRLRVVSATTAGARDFAVQNLYVGAP